MLPRKTMTKKVGITHDTTRQVYKFIYDHIRSHNRPPTMREISAACFIGRSTTLRHLDRLEAGGWIVREPGLARGILLTDKTLEGEPPS